MAKKAMFVQPMFNYKADEWLAMVYGYNSQKPSDKPIIGFAFKTKQYAKEFFNLMKAYNNGNSNDKEDNIRLSIIIEDQKNYSVFIYPSTEREIVKDFMDSSKEQLGNDTQPLITQLTICKKFPYGENSSLKGFRDILSSEMEVRIIPFIMNPVTQEIKPIEEIEPIVKSKVLITDEKLLDQGSIEYQHLQSIKRL